jgi:hypothetical protein
MSAKVIAGVLGIGLVLTTAPAAQADWVRGYYSGYYYRSSYYYPTYYYPAYYYPAYYYPVATPVYLGPTAYCPPPVVVRPVVGDSYFAQPQAAPPSGQSKEPPMGKKMNGAPPVVTESHSAPPSNGKAVPVVSDDKAACRVGFWNISGRDVKLTIDGKTHVVPSNRNMTLMVAREFSYQIDGQAAQKEAVPLESNTHEIVIR